MPSISIACGAILILIGIVGYIHGVTTGHGSITALIPAFFGIVLLLLGIGARASESLRKHLMHAGVIVGLLGFVLPFGRLLSNISGIGLTAAVVSQAAMSLVCLLFVVLAVRSFIAARRDRAV